MNVSSISSTDGARTGPVRVGLVGLGYWGPNLARVLYEMPEAELAWLCDTDPDRTERLSGRYPTAQATQRFEDLLADDSLDAIVVATPVFTHHQMASKALRAGKHTFVEKPLASSSEEADDLVEAASEAGLTLMCGHTFLYSPPVRAVKALLDSGELGDLYFITASRVNLGLHQRDVSVIWDLGPHDFSILLYWLGEMPHTIRAVGRDSVVKGIPDVAFITLDFASGVIVNIELSWLAPSKLRRTALVASKKMVVYDDTASEQVRVFDHGVVYEDPETFGQYQLSYRTGDILSPKLDTAEPLAVEVADFVAAVIGDGQPAASAEISRNVVRLIECAERSLAAGGAPVEVLGAMQVEP